MNHAGTFLLARFVRCAGYAFDSRAIKRVITASEEKRPPTRTVARVMDFLDELGKEAVQLTKRRGKKLIVIDPDMADQLTHHDRCDQKGSATQPERVILDG